jgi:RNA recognition motif-containing protein
MPKKLYVGNLPFAATEDSVKNLFSQYGEVTSVTLVNDPATGRPRGFGFVEMENADAAMAELNGKQFEGRQLKIDLARERTDRGGGGGYGDRPRGGGGYGNRSRGGGGYDRDRY